jgi:hypothetical protein
MAGEDTKFLKQLQRYQNPAAVADALKNARSKIDELSRANMQTPKLADDATPEQVTEWRKANGIPDTPEGYQVDLGEGVTLQEYDKPAATEYMKAMHEANATPEMANAGLRAMLAIRDSENEALQEQDNADTAAVVQELRDDWGPDYAANKNALQAIINQLPEEVREPFMKARMGDDRALMNSAPVIKFLVDVSRKLNPAATVTNDLVNPTRAVDQEISQIELWMNTQDPRYWKSEETQARYRELLDAKDALSKSQ